MNWTSTTVPLWQMDCENFRRAGGPFEVRDVHTNEQRLFILAFASEYGLTFAEDGMTFRFDGWYFSRAGAAALRA
jgi:hypothetical protein